MKTYFADPRRTDRKTLVGEIQLVSQDPILSGLLSTVGGLLAILDEQRQIVALNDAFCKMLGITDSKEFFGLRLGEALHCTHADDEPAGCGTTKFCSTCGAAIAIVASLKTLQPAERLCALRIETETKSKDCVFKIRSQPIQVKNNHFLLLFLQDVTLEQHRAALQRVFFHDINNMLTGLVGASELLSLKEKQSDLSRIIHKLSLRMSTELEIQKLLIDDESFTFTPHWETVETSEVLKEIQTLFSCHPKAENKILAFIPLHRPQSLQVDSTLLIRILSNMITNALEASAPRSTVKIWMETKGNMVTFNVWNDKAIPPDIARRIFHRNFSTKTGQGRGIGTYSMKLLGEDILGGKVSFTTSEKQGTTFSYTLPLEPSRS